MAAVDALRALRKQFGEAARRKKLIALQGIDPSRVNDARTGLALHDALLFACAFPDNAAIRAAAENGLAALGRRLARLPVATRRLLDDSGLEGSTSRYAFPFGIAGWLAAHFPGEVAIDWTAFTERSGLDALVRQVATAAERDALDAGALDARAWLHLAGATAPTDELRWILRAAGRGPLAAAVQRYDSMGLPLRWRLTGSPGSATRNRVAFAPVVHRARGFRRAPASPARFIATPLREIVRPTGRDATRVLDAARAALAARCREVDAISYPNHDEVWLADLGEGARLAVIGAVPRMRLALEANYGYVLFSNGVPIGYGGVSPLFFDANTGINIFEAFRGGEAAYLWCAMLRTFRTLFGTTRFVVNAYQFGEGNTEAIASGAFWFYYRLGFRPAARDARRLAAREAARLRNNRSHRSTSATLRALATGDLHLVLPGFREELVVEEAWLERIARGVARNLAGAAPAARASFVRQGLRDVFARLGVSSRERGALVAHPGALTLGPVIALLDGIERWPEPARRALVDLMRTRGGPRERDYVRSAQRHRRFLRALRRWCLEHP